MKRHLLLVTLLGAVAHASEYTKCFVENPKVSSTDWCLPRPEDLSRSSFSLSVPVLNGSSYTVVAVPAKNCRAPDLNELRGRIVFALDNSESMRTTDPRINVSRL